MKKLQFIAVLPAALSAAVTSAGAQSLDYSTISELFGEPVTTSANGSPQRQSEVALNLEILTAEDIARTGARNIPEALRHIPGVDVRRHTFGQYEVGIRGYNQGNAERILVLVNGRQVYTDFFGQVVWDGIPVEMSDIQQIEVVKGPNTALFGFNAVSGVVNVITYNPLYDEVRTLTARGGTQNFYEGSGTISQKVSENVGFRLSLGGYEAKDDFDDVEDAKDSGGLDISSAVEDTDRASVALDLWAQLADNIQGNVELTKNESTRNERLVTHAPSTNEYDTYSVRGRVLADTPIGLIEFDAYHNESRVDFEIGDPEANIPLQADNRITVVKLSDTFELGSSSIFRVAGEYRSASNIFTSSAAELNGDDLTYDIWSGSVLWDWRATDTIRTSAAFRYDNFELDPDGPFVAGFPVGAANPFTDSQYEDQTREEYSYNLGVTYAPDDVNTFRAMTARGADLPSFVEFGFQTAFLPGTVTSNPSGSIYGDPENDTSIVTNYELGYDRKVDAINGLFRSAIFYQYNDEMQSFDGFVEKTGGPFEDRSIITNIGDSEMYGVELGLDGVYDERWNWGVNYTFIEIEDDFRNKLNEAQRSSVAAYEDSVVNHIFNARLGYKSDNWTADLFGQYRSSFDDIVEASNNTNSQYRLEGVNSEVIVSANFAYDITDMFTWSVSGTSLLGDTQQSVEYEAETVVWTALQVNF
ncbi:MAG: TonB-dependent receptor [Alphaproteobacteria bacterium]|nr:TonB-dependent receptor [Alphaproteobacteria bacterium]